MEVFYAGWIMVNALLAADAHVPRESALPEPPRREVAKYLEARRDYPVLDVVDDMAAVAQPELLQTRGRVAAEAEGQALDVATCAGGLILHLDGTVAGCTNDEDGDCAGLDARHQSEPHRCIDWHPNGCDYCGIHP